MTSGDLCWRLIAFLIRYSTTLASALYLLLLRYLNRNYRSVVQLVDTVSSDDL
jgi:hypothetical protein